jgi:hypothetical protein
MPGRATPGSQRRGDTMSDQQPRVEWQQDESFSDEGLVVQVNRLPLRRPRFSISVSFEKDGGHPSRFLPVQSSVELGRVVMTDFADRVHALLQLAESHIFQQLQACAEQEQADRIAREQSHVNRGPKPVVGLSGGPGSGKTARRREAKRAAKTVQE